MPTATEPAFGWQLNGDSAAAYERYLVSAIFDQFARDLVELAASALAEHDLNVACGTGVVARYAAPRVGEDGRVVFPIETHVVTGRR